MNKQGRVLIVDDEKRWGKELAETLQREGFSADAVENVAQALEQLSTILYHIVVLDIRLPSSEEGIDLLKELDERGLKEATKVIMHSGYGTLEQMRLAFKDYDVADFVPKTSPEAFLKSVQQVFNEKVKINPVLDIQWQMKNDVAHLVTNLRIKGKRVGGNHFLRQRLVEELHDLFCRLFYEAETILVQPLTQGWSGSGVVLVQPLFKGRGRGEDVIVKFGDTKKIKKEDNNFEQHVKNFMSGGRSTVIRDRRYTPHLGGIVYSLLGAGNDQVVDFDDFYRNTNDLAKISGVLHQLFQGTCANWYRNRLPIQLFDLAAEYQQLFGYSPRKLERILASALPSVHLDEKLRMTSLNDRTFTNPLSINVKQSFMCYSSTCIVHGDLNTHNLLIDQSGFTWLIDFQATERGHILRDFAMLDSAIRLQLLTSAEASLEERLQMEEILCNAKSFSQMEQRPDNLPLDNPAVAKVYATIIALRTLAGSFVTQHQHDDISEYYIALFYNALNMLQISSLETVQYEHALLCASLLVDRLGLKYQNEPSWDISKVQSAISDKSFRNYSQLTEIIIRSMRASNPIWIKTPYFEQGTILEISLPAIGLRLPTQKTTQKAILLLRQKEENHAAYEHLSKIQSEKDAEFIIVVDIADIPHSPLRIDSGIIWFRPENLIEMIGTAEEDLPGWLLRFITTQVDVKSLLPYRTHGAATELFFGRDYELMRLIGGNLRGGIIIGANRSGKTSLLHRLGERLKQRGLMVVGPITVTGIESFFERTLIDSPLSIDCSTEMTPETWASALRAYSKREGKSPVFLLDEVDSLIAADTARGLILERQMRSLQSDGQSEFYLAGHARLREAIALEGGPLRNFAEEIVLTGLTEAASMSLIQEPMKRLGFYVSDDQARRIFRGTAGVAVLIQKFCLHLLKRRVDFYKHFHHNTEYDIEDAAIEAIEQFPDYLSEVFDHYKYGQEGISKSIMFITAIFGEVTRQDITLEFNKRGVKLSRDQLDAALEFLVQFGVLEEFKAGHYRVLSGYLSEAIMTRDPHSLLETNLKIKGRKEESSDD